LFADRDLRAPHPEWWPEELVHDVPHEHEEIRQGSPVCTLISATAEIDELAQLGARLLAQLSEPVASRG
jgi:predicted ATP-grasp superfamily ATP-dependent carboligase